MRRIAAPCALFLCTGIAALGQQVLQPADLAVEAEIEEIRRYSVELIIFEYTDSNAAGTEIFVADEPPPQEDLLLELGLEPGRGMVADPVGEDAEAGVVIDADVDGFDEPVMAEFTPEELILGEIPGPQQLGLKVAEPGEYSLDEIYEKLVELDAYKPLMRTAWTQKTVKEDETQSIKLRRLGDPPLKLDGNVTLYLSRYLHLVLDLALEERPAKVQSSRDDDYRSYGYNRQQAGYRYSTRRAMPVYYRIQEDRIVRNGELRYYDHPKFGVVAKIMRVEENQLPPGELAPDTDALTGEGGQVTF